MYELLRIKGFHAIDESSSGQWPGETVLCSNLPRYSPGLEVLIAVLDTHVRFSELPPLTFFIESDVGFLWLKVSNRKAVCLSRGYEKAYCDDTLDVVPLSYRCVVGLDSRDPTKRLQKNEGIKGMTQRYAYTDEWLGGSMCSRNAVLSEASEFGTSEVGSSYRTVPFSSLQLLSIMHLGGPETGNAQAGNLLIKTGKNTARTFPEGTKVEIDQDALCSLLGGTIILSAPELEEDLEKNPSVTQAAVTIL